MELSPRKQAILAAIVKYHIATGEPVGSKWLTTTLENAPSSATLRNEMSDLCTLGYLRQPHTSAGRVPTGKGYEFYVNSLMGEESLPEALKQTVDAYLEKASVEPESLPLTAAKILSSITGLPAFCAKIADDNMTVKRVEVIPMGERLVMVVVFTSDSRTLSKLCKSGTTLTKEKIDKLTALIKGGIEGKAMWEMTAVQMQNLLYSAGANALEFSPIIAAVFDMIKDMGKSSIELAGESFLYSVFAGNSYKQELISFIERKEGILSLISKPAEKAAVIFGSATGFSELDSSTLVVAPYGPKGSLLGRLGVIGPTRMSYGRILSSIAYVSLKVSRLMTENLEFAE